MRTMLRSMSWIGKIPRLVSDVRLWSYFIESSICSGKTIAFLKLYVNSGRVFSWREDKWR